MMKPDPRIDPLTLQRLVDGELESEQVQQVLVDAQSAPEQWQDIALGFVENQTWQSAFQLQIGLAEQGAVDSCPAVIPSGSVDSAPVIASRQQTITPARRRNSTPWWVMAASLLVAGAIGFMVSEIQNRTVPSSNSLVENKPPSLDSQIAKQAPIPQDVSPQLTPASLTPAYHLEVPDNNEKFQNFAVDDTNARVPIYRVGSEQQLKQFQLTRESESAFPKEVLLRFSKSGYQIEQEIELISGQVGDGESFVVPVRTIRIVIGQ